MRSSWLAIALTGMLALCVQSCSVQRTAVSRSEELRTTELRSTESRDSVTIELRDTLKEVTTITIDRNDAGDTLRVTQVTDRDRVRSRADVRSKKEEVRVERDTVYVERRDSVVVQGSRFKVIPSTLILTLKWIFWILVAGAVLIIVLKFGRKGIL